MKFVGVPIPKIWLIFDHGIKRPGDLDLSMASRVTDVMNFLHAIFQLATPFHHPLTVRHETDRRTDRRRPSMHNAPPYGDGGIINAMVGSTRLRLQVVRASLESVIPRRSLPHSLRRSAGMSHRYPLAADQRTRQLCNPRLLEEFNDDDICKQRSAKLLSIRVIK